MDLILWRHAEAHEAVLGEDDMQRVLTPRGRKQAERMAVWLES
ncbi:MAG: Phosphohistidine phosphatase SixA, partial [Pseudomonadota bacterium]